MIKNEAKITNDVEVNINRAAIEHRATWMGLIFDELRKDGIDPEPAFRRAIRRCGNFHGKGFKEACGGSNDGKKFAGVFLGELGQKTFEMDVHEVTDSEVPVDFHYCALTLRIISGSAGSAACQLPSGSLLSGRAWKMTYS